MADHSPAAAFAVTLEVSRRLAAQAAAAARRTTTTTRRIQRQPAMSSQRVSVSPKSAVIVGAPSGLRPAVGVRVRIPSKDLDGFVVSSFRRLVLARSAARRRRLGPDRSVPLKAPRLGSLTTSRPGISSGRFVATWGRCRAAEAADPSGRPAPGSFTAASTDARTAATGVRGSESRLLTAAGWSSAGAWRGLRTRCGRGGDAS